MSHSPLLHIDFNLKVLKDITNIYLKGIYVDPGSGDGSLTLFIVNLANISNDAVICMDIESSSLRMCEEKGFRTLKVDLNTKKYPYLITMLTL